MAMKETTYMMLASSAVIHSHAAHARQKARKFSNKDGAAEIWTVPSSSASQHPGLMLTTFSITISSSKREQRGIQQSQLDL